MPGSRQFLLEVLVMLPMAMVTGLADAGGQAKPADAEGRTARVAQRKAKTWRAGAAARAEPRNN